MKSARRGIVFSAALLLFMLSPAMGAKQLTWQEVASELMSPACPGRLLLDCPSGEGAQLRTLVKQKVDEGWTKAQIKEHFVKIYGEEYLAAPAKKGFYLLVWVVPFLTVAVGAFVVLLVMRIWRRKGQLEEQAALKPIPEGELETLSKKLEQELKEFDF